MRPIEKRIAAAEAKLSPRRDANKLVCWQPTDCTDLNAWEAECEAKAAASGRDLILVTFVGPR
jgi:hypothetical protein